MDGEIKIDRKRNLENAWSDVPEDITLKKQKIVTVEVLVIYCIQYVVYST